MARRNVQYVSTSALAVLRYTTSLNVGRFTNSNFFIYQSRMGIFFTDAKCFFEPRGNLEYATGGKSEQRSAG